MDDEPDSNLDRTIKPSSSEKTSENRSQAAKVELSRQDLVRLLAYLEGELQARDLVIATIKSETAKQLLYQAKYGRLGLNDPLASLQRDSESCGSRDDFDELSVGQMYESQLGQLEKLIAVQKRAHLRAKQVLAGAERRHAKTVRELEEERQRRANDAAQGDDVCMMLEKERERLRQELDVQKSEREKLEKEIERLNRLIRDEKERRKQIVLFLLQDRRQLAILFAEERAKTQQLRNALDQKTPQRQNLGAADGQSPSSVDKANFPAPVPLGPPSTAKFPVTHSNSNAGSSGSSSGYANLADLTKKITLELENTKKMLEKEREENASLKEIIRKQEEDIELVRQTVLAKSKKMAAGSSGAGLPPEGPPPSMPPTTSTKTKAPSSGTHFSTPTSSGGTTMVRYQILTRPAAPGSSIHEAATVTRSSSAASSSSNHPDPPVPPTSRPVSSASASSSIRYINPAYQQQSGSVGGKIGLNRQPSDPYSLATPPSFEHFGLVAGGRPGPGGALSSVAITPPPRRGASSKAASAAANGYLPQRGSTPGVGAGGQYGPGGDPTSSSLRLIGSRVALAQLPPSLPFPNSLAGSHHHPAGSGSVTGPASHRFVEGGPPSGSATTKRKSSGTSSTPVLPQSQSQQILPEIAHLEAVIKSMDSNSSNKDNSNYPLETNLGDKSGDSCKLD